MLVLAEVARFAKSFGGRNDAKYGANLMIARSVQEAKTDPALGGRLRFFDKDRESWASLRAVLSMEERFLVSDHEDRSASTKRAVPVICLPVPLTALGASGRWLALPGAPMTLLDDRPGIHQNLTQFVADCRAFGDFRQSVIDEVAAYFATEAKSVQSFASYKIGSNAVLNLDCSETCLLGEEEEFIATFSALVLPTQLLVADLVALVYP